jgi:L-threonine kinase
MEGAMFDLTTMTDFNSTHANPDVRDNRDNGSSEHRQTSRWWKAPATCGELVQGYRQGAPFLINSPIDFYAQARVHVGSAAGAHIVSSGHFSKVSTTVAQLLNSLKSSQSGLNIEIQSQLPRGKGMASSTAEIAAALGAADALLGTRLTPEMMGKLSVAADCSDGVAYPGISMVNQLTGERYLAIGSAPILRFIIVDCGGSIDSLHFDRKRAREWAQQHEIELSIAAQFVFDGIKTGHSRMVADGATLSAKVNQGLVPKDLFNELLLGTKAWGALGVNCAHTGTVLGVMYDPREADGLALLNRVRELAGANRIIGDFALVNGGVCAIPS